MIQSKLLSQFPELVQAVTDKSEKNMDFRFGSTPSVLKRRQGVFTKLGLDLNRTVFIKCQQADQYKIVDSSDVGKGVKDFESGLLLDALITTERGLTLALLIADCLPIILYDPTNQVIALVHVGRNGAEKGLLQKVISVLVEKYTTDVKRLVMFIGPGILADSYVLDKVDKMDTRKWGNYISEYDYGYHIDLKNFVLSQAQQAGVLDKNMEMVDINTYVDANYYSHRRSVSTGEPEGRFMAIVALK